MKSERYSAQRRGSEMDAETCGTLIEIYAEGVMSMSVCAPADLQPEDVEAGLAHVETGLDRGWMIAKRPFSDGQTNPHRCEQRPGREHWLMEC